MKQVRLVLILLLLGGLLPRQLLAQAARWQWAGAQPFTINALATDAAGNTYATGHFRGTIVVGGQQLTCPHNQYDLLVVKYDPRGQVLWAAALPAQPRYPGDVNVIYASGSAISVNPATGEAYVVGLMQGGLPAALGRSLPQAQYPTDKFVVLKLSAAGQPQWAVQGGSGSLPPRATAVATDAGGNCYVTGYNPFTLSNSSATSLIAWRQLFVLALDSAGRTRWAVEGQSVAGSSGYDIGVDAQNGVYVLGNYSGPMTFGGLSVPRTSGRMVARLNAGTGAVLWARGDGVGYQHLAVDESGHSYAVGLFQDSLRLGGHRIGASAATEGFVVRFTPSGGVDWLRAAGGAEAYSAADVALAGGQPTLLLKRSASTTAVVALRPDGAFNWEQTATGVADSPRLSALPGVGPPRWVLGGPLAGPAGFGPWQLLPASTDAGFVAALEQPAALTTALGAAADAGLQVYPNPARAQLRWQLAAGGTVQVQLLDASGQLVRSTRTTARGTDYTLDVADLARGLYLLRVSGSRQTWQARVQLE